MWRKVRQAATLAGAVGAAAIPLGVLAQEIHPGEQVGLGLRGQEMPALLKAVAADPYKAPAAPACETIPAEILALDKLLGADADQAQPHRSYVATYAVREAKGAVRGLIPYRGAIRFITSADKKDHDLVAAAQAGFARRGFLRGLEANLNCAPPKLEVAAMTAAPTVPAARAEIVADVQRIRTAYAPAPMPAAGETPQLDLASVMIDGPADTPGR